MDFTFTSPQRSTQETGQRVIPQLASGTAPPMLPPLQQQQQQSTLFQPATGTTAAPPAAAAAAATAPFTFNVLSAFDLDNINPDNPYDRVSLKKSRGVGSTRQWRNRLISQVEDKIKEKRTSIQNGRRAGLVRLASSSGTSEPSSSQEQHSQQHPQYQLARNDSFDSATSGMTLSQLTEEEHFWTVQEVWEAFKRENYEELARDLEGMTDQDIADMEQEIYQYNYTTDYDPIYDSMMDMEDKDMDETIEMYMKMDQRSHSSNGTQEDIASTIALSVTMLAQQPCIRCHSAPFQFESQPSSTATAANPSAVSRVLCNKCGYCLEQDALHYIGTSARNHNLGCAGQLQLASDDDTGLLMLCSHCDFMA